MRPLAALAALAPLVALACVAVFAYWGVWLPLHSAGYDFTGPYEAAYALGRRATLQLYDVPAQRAYNAATLHLPEGPSDFRWTPPMAALLIPLGWLPYAAARIIWWALGLAALLASLWLLARCAIATRTASRARGPAGSRGAWRVFAVLFCASAVMQPVTDSLRLGQSTPLLLLGFALMAYGEVFDRQALSGAGLALAILDKLFPAALLVYFLWRGRYRVCAVALGTLALLCLVTLPLTGLAMYGDFARALLTYSNEPNAGAVNLSLYHALIVLLSALFRPGQPEPRGGALAALAALVCAALFGLTLIAGGWPAARGGTVTDARGGETSRWRFFLFSWMAVALLAVEPIDWVFYYLLPIVTLAWLLSQPEAGMARVWRLGVASWRLLALLALALAVAPLPFDTRVAPPMSLPFVAGICARPLGLVGLWLAHAAFAAAGRGARVAGARDPEPAPAT